MVDRLDDRVDIGLGADVWHRWREDTDADWIAEVDLVVCEVDDMVSELSVFIPFHEPLVSVFVPNTR